VFEGSETALNVLSGMFEDGQGRTFENLFFFSESRKRCENYTWQRQVPFLSFVFVFDLI
jgi:hypothetical protein